MRILRRYWENTKSIERGTFALMLLPAMASLDPSFRLALPFWIMGFLQAAFSFRRVAQRSRLSLKLYLAGALILVVANTLLQYNWISNVWTRPLTHLFWFGLGMPAGQHFFVYAQEGGPEIFPTSGSYDSPRKTL